MFWNIQEFAIPVRYCGSLDASSHSDTFYFIFLKN